MRHEGRRDIGLERELLGGLIPSATGFARVEAQIAHVAQHMAAGILGDRLPYSQRHYCRSGDR